MSSQNLPTSVQPDPKCRLCSCPPVVAMRPVNAHRPGGDRTSPGCSIHAVEGVRQIREIGRIKRGGLYEQSNQ